MDDRRRFTRLLTAGCGIASLFWIISSRGLCVESPPDPPVNFTVGKAEAEPGSAVPLVVSVRTDVPLRALAIALDFDESRVRIIDFRRIPPTTDVNLDPYPPPSDISSSSINNVDQEPGNQLSEGWFFIEMNTGGEDAELALALAAEIPILEIMFLVLPGAPLGFTPVKFAVVGPVDIMPSTYFISMVEEANVTGVATALGPGNLSDGGIDIIGEVGFFMRGDANFDKRRDISDPILCLHYLFLGGGLLPCEDSSDSNDDGRIDIADPIFTLKNLFESSGPFPEPAEWGPDPTQDGLGCAVYPGR